MSIDDDTLSGAFQGPAPLPIVPRKRGRGLRGRRRFRPRRPRVRKLRLLFVLAAFSLLAVISVLFGVLTSIASDLPGLENTVQFRSNVDSYMYDANGTPIGPVAPASKPSIDKWDDISVNMVHAIVSVEDKGFWGEPGIDLRGLVRAGLSDATGGPREGGSTIPEEFVKNVRQEEDHRTVLEKLVEAGMAFQLTHRWTHAHILVEYLNSIYFGNGALGVEDAARIYFGRELGYDPAKTNEGCGDPDPEDRYRKECARGLSPAQSALLAGMVANPTEFDPLLHPVQATGRRNLVLRDMYVQHYISHNQYVTAINTPVPTKTQIQDPTEPSAAPYFTSWVEPLIVKALRKEGLSQKAAEYEADYGGLKITLSVNLTMQDAAQTYINDVLPPGFGKPSASLVAINNSNGEVDAMVSGDGNYQASPFNLATLGYRQPGSSFKLFTLAAALSSQAGYGPDSVFDSEPVKIPYTLSNGNTAIFNVHNFGNVYAGSTTLRTATATSDNSVFAQLGDKVGTENIKKYAQEMGIRSQISTYPSMILGGLTQGVSALDLAHAYSTEANDGVKVWNPTLGDYRQGPVGIVSIKGCHLCNQTNIYNNSSTIKTRPVLTPDVASEIHELLLGPVDDSYGTGTAAAIPGVDVAGKTGTTSNYVDAWFVGWTPKMTVAVWVGYPNSGTSMATDYYGKPVEGGTYPAIIWHDFMVEALQIQANEAAGKQTTVTSTSTSAEVTPTVSSTTGTATSTTTTSTGTVQTTPVTTGAATQGSSSGSPNTTSAGGSPTSDQTATPTTATPPPATASGTSTNGGSGL